MASRVDPEVEKYRVRLARIAERFITRIRIRSRGQTPFYYVYEDHVHEVARLNYENRVEAIRAEALRQLGIHQKPNVTHGAWSLFDSFIDELEAKFYWVDSEEGWLALTIVVNTRTKKVAEMHVGKSSPPMHMSITDWHHYP